MAGYLAVAEGCKLRVPLCDAPRQLARLRGVGLCYQLGGDKISVLSAVISLPADIADNKFTHNTTLAMRLRSKRSVDSTRWATTLQSKVNLPQAISCRASCGANLVTCPAGSKPAYSTEWFGPGYHMKMILGQTSCSADARARRSVSMDASADACSDASVLMDACSDARADTTDASSRLADKMLARSAIASCETTAIRRSPPAEEGHVRWRVLD